MSSKAPKQITTAASRRQTANISRDLARRANVAASLEGTTVKAILEAGATPHVEQILKKHGVKL